MERHGCGAPTESVLHVHQRLERAERELRIQFLRIAQLQAQLDVLLGALRRSPEVHLRSSTTRGRGERHGRTEPQSCT